MHHTERFCRRNHFRVLDITKRDTLNVIWFQDATVVEKFDEAESKGQVDQLPQIHSDSIAHGIESTMITGARAFTVFYYPDQSEVVCHLQRGEPWGPRKYLMAPGRNESGYRM